ncbi:MAG TPA: MBL fold metallo-hydrolase [Acidimicrobiales bacterium]|nr:MBL fold metallo-hydrolase [Acidimicrobiales bacterium]
MLTVEMLPAGFGDAILVTYGTEKEPHRLLIDGGQAGSFPAVAQRLRSFDGPIDLLVVTHVDNDHVGGAVKLLSDAELASRFGGIWFNGFVHLERFSGLLGPIHGERLTARIVELGLPWNAGWPDPIQPGAGQPPVGGPVVVGDEPPVMALAGGATATVLSPTPEKLAELLPVWQEVVEAAGLRPGVEGTEEPASELVAPGLLGGVTLEDLAGSDTDDDAAEANGSSIAFVFEFGGVRVLFGADAHPDALLAGLSRLAGADGRYAVQACKLPHHGSSGNVTSRLVAALDCPLWMISTNGRRFHHPDDEALARVIHGAPERTVPRLVWNYRSDRFTAFTGDHPPDASGYSIDVPDEGSSGIVVTLAD